MALSLFKTLNQGFQSGVSMLDATLEAEHVVEQLGKVSDWNSHRVFQAISRLKEISKQNAQAVAQTALPTLCAVLRKVDREGDGMLAVQDTLDCFSKIFETDKRKETALSAEALEQLQVNTRVLCEHTDSGTALLDLLRLNDMYVKYDAMTLLQVVQKMQPQILTKSILSSPSFIGNLMQTLQECKADFVRNECLELLLLLIQDNDELQKIVTFQGCVETLFGILHEEDVAQFNQVCANALVCLSHIFHNSYCARYCRETDGVRALCELIATIIADPKATEAGGGGGRSPDAFGDSPTDSDASGDMRGKRERRAEALLHTLDAALAFLTAGAGQESASSTAAAANTGGRGGRGGGGEAQAGSGPVDRDLQATQASFLQAGAVRSLSELVGSGDWPPKVAVKGVAVLMALAWRNGPAFSQAWQEFLILDRHPDGTTTFFLCLGGVTAENADTEVRSAVGALLAETVPGDASIQGLLLSSLAPQITRETEADPSPEASSVASSMMHHNHPEGFQQQVPGVPSAFLPGGGEEPTGKSKRQPRGGNATPGAPPGRLTVRSIEQACRLVARLDKQQPHGQGSSSELVGGEAESGVRVRDTIERARKESEMRTQFALTLPRLWHCLRVMEKALWENEEVQNVATQMPVEIPEDAGTPDSFLDKILKLFGSVGRSVCSRLAAQPPSISVAHPPVTPHGGEAVGLAAANWQQADDFGGFGAQGAAEARAALEEERKIADNTMPCALVAVLKLMIVWLRQCHAAIPKLLNSPFYLPLLFELIALEPRGGAQTGATGRAKGSRKEKEQGGLPEIFAHIQGLAALLVGVCIERLEKRREELRQQQQQQGKGSAQRGQPQGGDAEVDVTSILQLVASRVGLEAFNLKIEAMRRTDAFVKGGKVLLAAPQLSLKPVPPGTAPRIEALKGLVPDRLGFRLFDPQFAQLVTEHSATLQAALVQLYLQQQAGMLEGGPGSAVVSSDVAEHFKDLIKIQDLELRGLKKTNEELKERLRVLERRALAADSEKLLEKSEALEAECRRLRVEADTLAVLCSRKEEEASFERARGMRSRLELEVQLEGLAVALESEERAARLREKEAATAAAELAGAQKESETLREAIRKLEGEMDELSLARQPKFDGRRESQEGLGGNSSVQADGVTRAAGSGGGMPGSSRVLGGDVSVLENVASKVGELERQAVQREHDMKTLKSKHEDLLDLLSRIIDDIPEAQKFASELRYAPASFDTFSTSVPQQPPADVLSSSNQAPQQGPPEGTAAADMATGVPEKSSEGGQRGEPAGRFPENGHGLSPGPNASPPEFSSGAPPPASVSPSLPSSRPTLDASSHVPSASHPTSVPSQASSSMPNSRGPLPMPTPGTTPQAAPFAQHQHPPTTYGGSLGDTPALPPQSSSRGQAAAMPSPVQKQNSWENQQTATAPPQAHPLPSSDSLRSHHSTAPASQQQFGQRAQPVSSYSGASPGGTPHAPQKESSPSGPIPQGGHFSAFPSTSSEEPRRDSLPQHQPAAKMSTNGHPFQQPSQFAPPSSSQPAAWQGESEYRHHHHHQQQQQPHPSQGPANGHAPAQATAATAVPPVGLAGGPPVAPAHQPYSSSSIPGYPPSTQYHQQQQHYSGYAYGEGRGHRQDSGAYLGTGMDEGGGGGMAADFLSAALGGGTEGTFTQARQPEQKTNEQKGASISPWGYAL